MCGALGLQRRPTTRPTPSIAGGRHPSSTPTAQSKAARFASRLFGFERPSLLSRDLCKLSSPPGRRQERWKEQKSHGFHELCADVGGTGHKYLCTSVIKGGGGHYEMMVGQGDVQGPPSEPGLGLPGGRGVRAGLLARELWDSRPEAGEPICLASAQKLRSRPWSGGRHSRLGAPDAQSIQSIQSPDPANKTFRSCSRSFAAAGKGGRGLRSRTAAPPVPGHNNS